MAQFIVLDCVVLPPEIWKRGGEEGGWAFAVPSSCLRAMGTGENL